MVARNILKERYETALHLSVVQHATPQFSPLSSHALFAASQRPLLMQEAVTEWISNPVPCLRIQVSSAHVFTYLASLASIFDFEQTEPSSDSLPNSKQEKHLRLPTEIERK